MAVSNQTKAVEKSSLSGCLVRLFWVFAGNAILLLTAASIAREKGWGVGWADLVFGLTLAFLLAARFMDARYFEPKERGEGPASLAWIPTG
jgi:hypothetical protein